MNICLIGARGVGKSRTARRLGVLLKRPVISTDLLVSYECGGKSVAAIIRKKGGGVAAWRFFRQKEFEVLREAVKLKNVVIDCGGGIVVDIDRRGRERFSGRKVRLLRKKNIVVWLKGDARKPVKKNDARRPALSGAANPGDIMKRRKPFYAKAAHLAIRTDSAGAKTLARRIIRRLKDD